MNRAKNLVVLASLFLLSSCDNRKEIPELPEDKKYSLVNFSSYTKSDGSILFSWERPKAGLEGLRLIYSSANGEDAATIILDENVSTSYSFVPKLKNQFYNFSFDSLSKDGEILTSLDFSRFIKGSDFKTKLPVVEIETEHHYFPGFEYVSKPGDEKDIGANNTTYINTKISLKDKDGNKLFDSVDKAPIWNDYKGAFIRIRGNSSAFNEQAPYKIKLNRQIDLLSNLIDGRDDKDYRDDSWVLFPSDNSLTSHVDFTVPQLINDGYSPRGTYVEVYLNGDYRGLYYLCESVNKGNGSLDKQARVPLSSNGYLIENNPYWWKESCSFDSPITKDGPTKYTFLTPNPEKFTKKSSQYTIIKDYINDFENALLGNSDNNYLDYIDIDSFSNWLLVQDIMGTSEKHGSNVYLTKYDKRNSTKLKMGPIWDLGSLPKYNRLSGIRHSEFNHFKYLLQHEDFLTNYKSHFESIKNDFTSKLISTFDQLDSEVLESVFLSQNLRWGALVTTISEEKERWQNWFDSQIQYMSENI